MSAEVRGPDRLWLSFNDGTRCEVGVRTLLSGPMFELREPSYFAQATLDPVCGTVVWPNGAEFAPEALRALVGASAAAV